VSACSAVGARKSLAQRFAWFVPLEPPGPCGVGSLTSHEGNFMNRDPNIIDPRDPREPMYQDRLMREEESYGAGGCSLRSSWRS
jgi:hypothetical protein